ncbi:hypothetical protein M5K25_020855 [Dendrobium thyrsiflorum]|uniref:Uncharacterized protein n=1 Tax=Dendrobium thyrsiflorum TaxID=117978 RepID=A0ABD0UID3_DENTH
MVEIWPVTGDLARLMGLAVGDGSLARARRLPWLSTTTDAGVDGWRSVGAGVESRGGVGFGVASTRAKEALASKFLSLSTGIFCQQIPEYEIQVSCSNVHHVELILVFLELLWQQVYHHKLKTGVGGNEDEPDQDPMVPSSRAVVFPGLLSQRRKIRQPSGVPSPAPGDGGKVGLRTGKVKSEEVCGSGLIADRVGDAGVGSAGGRTSTTGRRSV